MMRAKSLENPVCVHAVFSGAPTVTIRYRTFIISRHLGAHTQQAKDKRNEYERISNDSETSFHLKSFLNSRYMNMCETNALSKQIYQTSNYAIYSSCLFVHPFYLCFGNCGLYSEPKSSYSFRKKSKR